MPFEEDLTKFLTGWRRLMLVGIGSRIRRDDAAGLAVISRLRGAVPPSVGMLDCGTVPENYSLDMKRFQPTHLVFFDAVEMGAEPGSRAMIAEDELIVQSFSTHKQSVKVLFMVLREGIPGVRIALAGIQPKTTEFGRGISRPVARGISAMSEEVSNAIRCTCHEND